jgi:hypothetical protein
LRPRNREVLGEGYMACVERDCPTSVLWGMTALLAATAPRSRSTIPGKSVSTTCPGKSTLCVGVSQVFGFEREAGGLGFRVQGLGLSASGRGRGRRRRKGSRMGRDLRGAEGSSDTAEEAGA